MRPRIFLARFLIRLGRFVSSLALMVMRPDDLMEFSRQFYGQGEQVNFWGHQALIDQGLTPLEQEILEKTRLTQGKVLVLAMGGGRDAISLAQRGFSVTGMDFIPELVELARENAARHGVRLEARVGDLSRVAAPPGTFDLAWLSDRMYSCIPTRRRRVEMLQSVYQVLRPGGWFACMFNWFPITRYSPATERVRKLVAYLTLGNIWYEPGDVLLGESEFIHGFKSEGEIASEFAEAGFELGHPLIIQEEEHRGLALLHKAAGEFYNSPDYWPCSRP